MENERNAKLKKQTQYTLATRLRHRWRESRIQNMYIYMYRNMYVAHMCSNANQHHVQWEITTETVSARTNGIKMQPPNPRANNKWHQH